MVCIFHRILEYNVIFDVEACAALNLGNGQISYNKSPGEGKYPVGTVASFLCDPGYNRQGSSSKTCQASGSWDNNPTTCNQSN